MTSHRSIVCLASLLAGGLLVASPAVASPPDRLEEIRELRERVESARTHGNDLRRELRDLREANSDEVVSERRAAAIREMVAAVTADAGARASLLGNGYSAGWDGGFFLQDPDGRFRLDVAGHAQFRHFLSKIERAPNDATRAGFEQTRTRLMLSGHVFTPDLQYFVQVDPTRNERQDQSSAAPNQRQPSVNLPSGLFLLEDAWVRYRMAPNWFIRAGQFKLPFNREELVDPSRQLVLERSLVNESLNIGRSQGIELQYRDDLNRINIAVHDGATDDIGGTNRQGLVDPEPKINSNALAEGAEWAFAGRWETLLAGSWRQFDDLTSSPGDDFGLLFGLAGHAYKTESNGAPSNTRDEARWYGATTDLSVEFGGANLFASMIYQYVDIALQFEFYGLVLQGGMFIHPEHELYARWEWGQVEGTTQADLNVLTVGWNYYLDGHDLKFTTDFGFAESIIDLVWTAENAGFRQDQREDEHQWVLRSQFQFIF